MWSLQVCRLSAWGTELSSKYGSVHLGMELCTYVWCRAVERGSGGRFPGRACIVTIHDNNAGFGRQHPLAMGTLQKKLSGRFYSLPPFTHNTPHHHTHMLSTCPILM